MQAFLEFHLASEAGIAEVAASANTGNILVHFDGQLSLAQLQQAIEQQVAAFWEAGGIWEPPQPVATDEAWHQRPHTEALAAFRSDAQLGLSEADAAERLRSYGPNQLPEPEERSEWEMFFGQFQSLPVALLGLAAGVSVATGGLVDAVVILGVVGLNAVIGYLTESQSEKVIRALAQVAGQPAIVIRAGEILQIPAQQVVPGDLLLLKPGVPVAADARLIAAENLSVDESSLTGESLPVRKSVARLEPVAVPLADRLNMTYMGTVVTGGQGLAVVVATGTSTEMGRIQALAGEAQLPETPMQRQLEEVGSQLVWIAGAVCGGVFLLGLWRGQGFLQMLKSAISLAVAAVPEGLPTVATSTLALGIANMRRHNVLIRRLAAVEALGAVQTLCLDKTGTITRNQMSVVAIDVGRERLKLAEGRVWRAFNDEPVAPPTRPELMRLIEIAILCNESEIRHEGGQYTLNGSATENALVHLALAAGIDPLALKAAYPLRETSQRSEQRPYMSTVHETANPRRKLVALKGSPLEVLALCKRRWSSGRARDLTATARRRIAAENEAMAGEALRVLGFAFAQIEEGSNGSAPDFVWLGLVGMADPIRPGVSASLAQLRRAGIDTVMITGDQSATAYAVGKQLDLSHGNPLEILDSTRLDSLDPEVLKALSPRMHVFARVSPAHKLQIVQALQANGRVVAMTGDGINDGPALKAADIGIAMGNSGTDIAREVADVILEHDDLETMIVAVSHGRTIQRNIRKSIHFLLATNLSEILVTFTALLLGWGQPLSAIQLLWINLLSDVFPSLALALEPPEPDVLDQPPRDPAAPIIEPAQYARLGSEATYLTAGTLAAYAWGMGRYGPAGGSTLAFTGLTCAQLLHALSCRSERRVLLPETPLATNPYLQLAIGGSLALQALALVVPAIRQLLGLRGIDLLDGAVIAGSALLPLAMSEITKKEAQP